MADIWMSTKDGNAWGKPVNLGNVINTPYQETTVFVSPDNKYLFFSSTGHPGMGGYDIYVSVNSNGVWGTPVNLGYPINTVADDLHFAYYPNLKRAYYSTMTNSQNKGIGARDIFMIDLTNYTMP